MLLVGLFISLFILLLFTKQWVQRYITGIILITGGSQKLAIAWYSFIFLPGIIVHELSHFITAAFLGVRTGEITLMPHSISNETDRLALGSVKIAKTDFFRGSIIGAAPFIFGLISLYAVTAIYLDQRVLYLDESIISDFTSQLVTKPFWISAGVMYLLWAIGNTLFTSKEDARSWPLLLIFITTSWLLMTFLGTQIHVIDSLFPLMEAGLSHIVAGLFVSVAINVIVSALLLSTVFLLERVTRKRLSYR